MPIVGMVWNILELSLWWTSFRAKENLEYKKLEGAIAILNSFWVAIAVTLVLFICDVKVPY